MIPFKANACKSNPDGWLLIAALVVAAVLTAFVRGQDPLVPDQRAVERIIAEWPDAARTAARTMLPKYGALLRCGLVAFRSRSSPEGV